MPRVCEEPPAPQKEICRTHAPAPLILLAADNPDHAPIFLHLEFKKWIPEERFFFSVKLVNALLRSPLGSRLGPPYALTRSVFSIGKMSRIV